MFLKTPYIRFTVSTVGVGGQNTSGDVETLQRLLVAAGVKVKGGADARWGEHTALALAKFQDDWDDATGAEFGLPPARSSVKVLQPDDDWLLRMAAQAQILMPMPAPKKDIVGVLQLHRWLQGKRILYEPKQDYMGTNSRSFRAVQARPNLAVQLQLGTEEKIKHGPIKINCTTYANIMLSVFKYGTLANPGYNPSVQNIGGSSSEHLSKARYQFQQIIREVAGTDGKTKQTNYFATAEQIDDATDDGKLYSMEIGSAPNRGVGHHAILYNGTVYQSHDSSPSAADCSLEKFMARATPCIYLFGQ
jgi:hypothetical protein